MAKKPAIKCPHCGSRMKADYSVENVFWLCYREGCRLVGPDDDEDGKKIRSLVKLKKLKRGTRRKAKP